ncbi:MAG: hypothetical protein E6522_08545 [Streptococcus vestibularis]|nr:hypothetical protein [Streptococcus vestibularis]
MIIDRTALLDFHHDATGQRTLACRLPVGPRQLNIHTTRAWFGHVLIRTTNIDAETDITLKANDVALCRVSQLRPVGVWKEDKAVMAFPKSW